MALCRARALSLFALLLVGCSGAGNADLFNGDPGAPPSSEDDDTAVEPVASTKKEAPGQPAAAPAPGSAPAPEAPSTPAPPTTPDPDPAPSCTHAAEPNNDLNHATVFTASLCGKIDSATDVDFGSFVVPAGKTQISIAHSEEGGKVAYRYYLQGILLPLAGDGMIVIPGMTYSVQAKLSSASNSGDRPTYHLDVSFK
jgi:hypothetical protein